VSLAEGETIRKLIHANHPVLRKCDVALRNAEGSLVDQSVAYAPGGQHGAMTSAVAVSLQCLRFFNCEMYYTEPELELLMVGLKDCDVASRLDFFCEILRLRRRERNLWVDTPLAKVFTTKEEWHLLRARAKIQQVKDALRSRKKLNARQVLERSDTDADGFLSYGEAQRAFEAMRLGFSPHELSVIVRLADAGNLGRIGLEELFALFDIGVFVPTAKKIEEEKPVTWKCMNCTFVNRFVLVRIIITHTRSPSCSVLENTCAMCEMGWTGKREVPADKWMCSGEDGGCTFFNSKRNFYCEVCNRGRPDLASVRF
jgi:hypothetical protein